MKYKVEVWRHHCLVVEIEANDIEDIKDLVEFWKDMADLEYCALEYYIDGKRLSIIEEIEFEREILGGTDGYISSDID